MRNYTVRLTGATNGSKTYSFTYNDEGLKLVSYGYDAGGWGSQTYYNDGGNTSVNIGIGFGFGIGIIFSFEVVD